MLNDQDMCGTTPAFLHAEDGAVTVDWVVLTAALVGLGLAVMGAVSTGTHAATTSISDTASARFAFDWSYRDLAYDFADGSLPFDGGIATSLGGWGEAVVLSAGDGSETMTARLRMPDHGAAVISFDLLALDSLDAGAGDGATVYLDGTPIARMVGDHGAAPSWEVIDRPGMTIDITSTGGTNVADMPGSQYGGDHVYARDAVSKVTITLDDPDRQHDLGFGASQDQALRDEGVALDNLTVTKG